MTKYLNPAEQIIIDTLRKRCRGYGYGKKDDNFIEFVALKLLKILNEKGLLKTK